MKAYAVVATAPRVIQPQIVDVPEPGPSDVVVRITRSWISNGTEGSFVRGERIAGDTPLRTGDPCPFPHVPGYQKCGTVERVGTSVKGIVPGDRVFATMSPINDMFFGAGGHVSPAVTHESQVWKLPNGLSDEAASGLVLLQVGYNCGIRPPVTPGDHAVVIGDGLVGHWAAQTLQHRGASVMLAGRHDYRLAKFRTGPTARTLNSATTPLAAAAAEWAPGGVAILVDTVGSVPSILEMLPAMRHDGHVVSAGFYGEQGHIDIQELRQKELTLHAPAGWSKARMDETLALLADGALQTEHLITHRFPVTRAADAFRVILDKTEPFLGVLLEWEGAPI